MPNFSNDKHDFGLDKRRNWVLVESTSVGIWTCKAQWQYIGLYSWKCQLTLGWQDYIVQAEIKATFLTLTNHCVNKHFNASIIPYTKAKIRIHLAMYTLGLPKVENPTWKRYYKKC